jgi:hypothetical protein
MGGIAQPSCYARAMACSMTKTMMMLAAVTLGCGPTGDLDDDDGAGSTTAGDSTAESGPTTTSDPTGNPTGDPSSGSTNPTDPTTTSVDSSDDGGMCLLPPLEQEIVDQLFIYGGSSGYVPVDASAQLSLAWIEFGFPTQVDACVEWSIDPIDGVTIDADGLLAIDAAVAAGTVIAVTADVESGRRILAANFTVYVPLEADILGYWGEVMQLPCDGGAPFVPEPVIPELVFRDTGEFTVTWTPFETYIDYGGTFTYDEPTGALVLTVDGGNYIPPDVDGEGTATVVDGQLVLEDIWLGTAQNPVTPPACGHVFE